MYDWYGIDDFVWQTIRLIFAGFLIYFGVEFSQSYTNYNNIAGLGIGYVLYAIIYRLVELVMLHVWDCEALNAYDSIFMLDDKKNISNITGALFFEEFEYESMAKYLIAKAETIHKCRHKLGKYFGVYFF